MRTLVEVARQLRELPEDSPDLSVKDLFESRHEDTESIVEIVVPGKTGQDVHLEVFDMRLQLQRTSKRCPRMQAFYMDVLQKHPNSLQAPWHVILYFDEMVPGNVLSPILERKQ